MKNSKKLSFAAAALSGVAGSAMAAGTGPDFTALTGAVSMDSTTVAVLAVAAMVIGVVLAVSGAKVINRMVKGI
ncbi:hypothetical protein C5615_37020 [Burkholderia cepacia]|uniref:Uncharacterized protein n=1 Tax=Burkholderia cepacia TaxID=292 RepID=A0A2S8HZY0_BURCE|nr:hypothetical protein [Burkholderia cepacia]PQP07989.1 hypothetical protein C5615_37020 [Burkholderia cepacia]HDR9511951.1 hypothetical protein [Burkholderia cepacia]